MGGVHVKETVIENNSQVKFLLTLRIDKDTDLLTNNWIGLMKVLSTWLEEQMQNIKIMIKL